MYIHASIAFHLKMPVGRLRQVEIVVLMTQYSAELFSGILFYVNNMFVGKGFI